jgi:hypothetical protein
MDRSTPQLTFNRKAGQCHKFLFNDSVANSSKMNPKSAVHS